MTPARARDMALSVLGALVLWTVAVACAVVSVIAIFVMFGRAFGVLS